MNTPTPGPWRKGELLLTDRVMQWSAEAREHARQQEQHLVFAHFRDSDHGMSRQLVARCERPDDASLVAAAPDLLAALKVCQVRVFMYQGSENDAYRAAETAIRQAEGLG